jgi:hypothetical protein
MPRISKTSNAGFGPVPVLPIASDARLKGYKLRERYFFAPRSEQWLFQDLTMLLVTRLGGAHLDERESRGLTRLLYGLQQFPRVSEKLKVTLSWRDDYDTPCGVNNNLYRESICSVRYSEDGVFLMKGDTLLAYNESHSYVRSFYDELKGHERQVFLESWMAEFSGLSDASTPVSVGDHSSSGEVDVPPLSELWNSEIRILTAPLGC